MAKFYEIQIGAIYLTGTGLVSGEKCKLGVTGADALRSNFTGSTIVSIDGTPINQIFETNRGKILEIVVSILTQSVFTGVVALINTALSNSGTIRIIGIGDIGNFDVFAVPLLPRPFEAQEFKNGRIKNVIFRFITT